MKNTQLKTNNKVLHNGIVKTVDSICRSAVTFMDDIPSIDKYGEWVDLDEVEFIPLTEELLINFGFIFSGIVQQKKYLRLIYEDGGKLFYYCHPLLKIEIKYVHQLQNLYFALTGEELEVKS